jgi:hypothetical protein
MTSRRDDSQGDLFHPDNEVDEVFARANPNPERQGCPSDEVLEELALRRRPIDDPGYEHLGQCSPCYRTFRQFQRERGTTPNRRESSYGRWVAVAAVLGLALTSAWFFASRRDGSAVIVDGAEVRTEMDLRKYAVSRSDDGAETQGPLTAQRAKLDLTILLPVGSEEGSYELQVMDADLRSRGSVMGEARIENFVATLHTRIDTGSLAPGPYKLAIRRKGEDWRLFPVRLE